MVRIEVGGEYSASMVKRGRKDDGEWQFVIVRDENPKSHMEIKLWVRSPIPLEQGSMFRVDTIHRTTYGMTQYREQWRPSISMEVDISALMSYPEYSAMSSYANPFDDYDELPL